MAKETYEVLVNNTGDPTSGGCRVRVQADSEFEAQRLAIQRATWLEPKQVASIKKIS